MEQFIRRLTYEKNYATNTIESYQRDLIELKIYLDKDIKLATAEEMDEYVLFTYTYLSPISVARKISCFRSFYKDLIRMGIREDNPMILIESPKLGRKLPNLVGETELGGLFDFLDKQTTENMNRKKNKNSHFEIKRDAMIFEFLYSCGLRVSELCDLKMSNIYIEDEILRVLGKGNKERLIPIGRRLKDMLLSYIPARQWLLNESKSHCEYIITSKFRKQVTRVFIWKVLKRYSEEMDITELHPHMLRHAFATHMLNHGADLRLIQELLGHSDLSATEIYTHVANENLHEALTLHHPLAQSHHL